MQNTIPYIRHLFSFIGGLLVSKGVLDEDTSASLINNLELLAGAASVVVSIVWYSFDKIKNNK